VVLINMDPLSRNSGCNTSAQALRLDRDYVERVRRTESEGGGAEGEAGSARHSQTDSGRHASSLREAQMVQTLVWGLKVAQFDLSDVGIITPFRAQVKMITEILQASSDTLATIGADSGAFSAAASATGQLGRGALACDVSTVDKYQGRDMDVVILSTVKGTCAVVIPL
jgi:hypothetical protein